MDRVTAKTFFQTVQAGDITLYDILDEAIAFFGYTKRGKTTSCHCISQSPLRAQQRNKEFVYVPSTKRFSNALVGVTNHSETWIPNIFESMVKDKNVLKKIFVLDQPGYADTYGFHRVFSNGYFHYRTFSKTPKLKFVLTIEIDDLRGTAQTFIDTVKKFMNTFNDWKSIKYTIMRATTILVTKTELQINQQSLLDIISSLKSAMKGKLAQYYTQFILDMLNNRKVFFIPKPSRRDQILEDRNLLQNIYDKTQFWQRPLLSKNIVDMSAINFEVSAEIVHSLRNPDNQLYKEQFEEYMSQAQQRIYGMILKHPGSLLNIVKCLENDAKGSTQSHNFLDLMKQFNQTYYHFLENYETKRKEVIANLFKNSQELNQTASTIKQIKQKSSIYFIKKFKVIEQIIQVRNQITSKQDAISVNRSIGQLENFSLKFMQMFKKMSILGIQKYDKENIIYKYTYILLRLIEESKIMTLILFKNQSIKNQISLLKVNVIQQDIYRVLLDRLFLAEQCDLKIDQLKREFMKKLDFGQIIASNQEVIDFFQSANNWIDNQICFKIAKFIIQYYKRLVSQDKKLETTQIKFIIRKLYLYRNLLFGLRSKPNNSQEEQEKCDQAVIELTQALAKILIMIRMFHQAKECFRTIQDADAIFGVYEIEANQIKQDHKFYRQFLIKQAEDATLYYRGELALICYQKAFSLSYTMQQKRFISQKIVKCCTEKKEQQQKDYYLQNMFNNNFISDFPQPLKASLQAESDIL